MMGLDSYGRRGSYGILSAGVSRQRPASASLHIVLLPLHGSRQRMLSFIDSQ